MSIFPTTILLATDGSKEAQLATKTAATLATSTNSELHVIHVGPGLPCTNCQITPPASKRWCRRKGRTPRGFSMKRLVRSRVQGRPRASGRTFTVTPLPSIRPLKTSEEC
jgi:hypothetical protein